MKNLFNCILMITISLSLSLSASASAMDNAEILGKLPFVKDVQLSPNGNKIALIQNIKGEYYIVVRDLMNTNTKPVVFSVGSAKVRQIEWGNNDRVIFLATFPHYSRGDYETFTIYRIGFLNVNNSKAIWPFNKGRYRNAIGAPRIINKLINDPEHILVSYFGDLLKINLINGDKTKLDTARKSSDWVTDANGEIIAYSQYSKRDDKFHEMLKVSGDKDFTSLKMIKDDKTELFEGNIQLVSQDKQTIFYTKKPDEDIHNLIQADVKNYVVTDKKTFSKNGLFDVNYVLKDNYDSQLIGVKFINHFIESDYFDTKLKQVYADLKATFPDSEVNISSYSKNKEKFIAKVSSQETPLEYFYYDESIGNLLKIADSYPNIQKLKLGKVKHIQYKATDGLVIPAYFTTPHIVNLTKPPLIVLPHGGPETRDTLAFDWLRQFFASEGYAVFQPNYRGSSGYGKKFAESGYGEWGKKMQQDIDDGVDKLIKDGLIDKDRICVVGASYGGYVALYSATARYKKYKCSVSFAGISNLDDMFYHAKEQYSGFTYWEKSIGSRKNKEDLLKYSPLHLISTNTRPILLFHGDKDTIVPAFQSEKMYKALKKAKVKGIEYIEFENEDHWISHEESRISFLRETLKFIKNNI